MPSENARVMKKMANALVPEFAVSNFTDSKYFYCNILGFTCEYERPEDGFAYLALGAAELMIDQIGIGRTFNDGHLPDAYPYGRGLNVQIQVADIAPLLSALNREDIAPYLPLEDKWYRKGQCEVGNRQFVVADPDGYLLRFFQSLGQR
jgi:catechol 2,3-dioxygenase-like lactoylglutathione lyase family enzyme